MPSVKIYKLKEGRRPILFGVHGAGGILFFANLARRLNADQPVYVMQGDGLDDPTSIPFADLKDLARHYVAEMTAIDPRGPYYLCGRFAPIVLEVGQQLLDSGKEVALMIVFDHKPPGLNKAGADSEAAEGLLSRTLRHLKSGTLHRAAVRALQGPSPAKKRRRNRSPAKQVNTVLCSNYVSEPYRGPVLLFQSEQFSRKKSKAIHLERWQEVATNLTVQVVPGSHREMWKLPHLEELVRQLQAHLDATIRRQSDESVPDGRN